MKKYAVLYVLGLLLFAGAASAQMTAQVGDFTLTFNGVQYSGGTSTWSYTLAWNKSVQNSPQLSHLTIGMCTSFTAANVVSATPPDVLFGADGSTGLFGIKWDYALITQNGGSITVTFTLDDTYAVGTVQFSAKAGQQQNIGSIYGPSCMVAHPHIDISKECPGAAFVGDSISYTITVTNDGNVALDDVILLDAPLNIDENLGPLAPGASVVRNGVLSAAAAGPLANTASVSGDYWDNVTSDSATCVTDVYALTVLKSAATHYDRDHDWSVVKSGDPAAEICHGETKPIAYTIDVQRTTIDSNHSVDGVITVINPAPIPAPLASVSDTLSPGGIVPVNCNVVFPYAIPANSSLQCSYAWPLPNADERTNTAVAVLGNGATFAGSAAVTWGAPDSVGDPSITVADSVGCPEGFTCSAAGPFDFSDSGTVSFEVNATNETALCDSYFDVTNTATWIDDGAPQSNGPVTTSVYSCRCAEGCTLTIGYWKTHAGFTGRNADQVTQYLPIWLGTPFGATSVQVTDATQAVNVLSMGLGTASNGITKLYAQLLAAKLNIARGASSTDVAATIAQADAYLATHSFAAWSSASKAEKSVVLTWMTLLDAYNNGDLGPGHCD